MGFTVEEAVDAIYKQFTDEWNAAFSQPPKLIYDDFGQAIPNTTEPWARIQIRHNGGEQATLQQVGSRKFERIGIVTVQLFSVLNRGRADADLYAQVASRAFEKRSASKLTGGPDEVWFRQVQINEIGRNEGWFQTNVTAQFEYDFDEGATSSDALLLDDGNLTDNLLIDDTNDNDVLLLE